MSAPEGPFRLRVAVLSDIHAYEGDAAMASPSFVCVSDRTDLSPSHPVSALFSLIRGGGLDDGLPVDVLLCPGDLGDKAQPGGIRYGWMVLNEVARQMGAPFLACTVGNHDVISRDPGVNPELVLQSLLPPYPTRDYDMSDAFWRDGFVVQEEPHYRLIVLNSSWRHGKSPDEYKYGRITPEVREAIIKRVRGDRFPINILVCHHHPHKHAELDLGEYDEMVGGQEFLKELSETSTARWLIVHGHKHHPKLIYAAGYSNPPIVFSAGSFGAKLYPELATVCRNQFYLLDLESNDSDGSGLRGKFRAWEYSKAEGWVPATTAAGLPARGGFGDHVDARVLANEVRACITASYLNWEEIEAALPKVGFILPGDLKKLITELRSLGVKVIVNEFGSIAQVGL